MLMFWLRWWDSIRSNRWIWELLLLWIFDLELTSEGWWKWTDCKRWNWKRSSDF
jgi:hypothetical protein